VDRIICYIPSYNDSQLVAHSLATVPDWQVVVSDNASSAPHAAALDRLASKRVRVIHQPRQLGRVGNWKFCVEHFIASGAGWMKFLPAGDRHKPGSLDACRQTLSSLGNARFVITNVEFVEDQIRQTSIVAPNVVVLSSQQAMMETIRQGNIFFGLLAALIHVEAVRDGFSFAHDVLSYCADMYFLLGIARRTPTVFSPTVVSEFVAEHRKVFQAGQQSLEHALEGALVRLRAVDYYAELTGDRRNRDELVSLVRTRTCACLDQPRDKLVGGHG
jgi:hypothetical protein